MDTDRVQSGEIHAAAKPILPFRSIPQRIHERPRRAAIMGVKESAGNGAAPKNTGLAWAAGNEFPN